MTPTQNRVLVIVLTSFLLFYLAVTVTTLLAFDMVETVLVPFGLVALAVLVYMVVAFIAARLLNRLDSVDVAWGGAFIVAAVASFALGPSTALGATVQLFVTLLVTIWGLRLVLHIVPRLAAKSEDKRYVALRQQWQGRVWRTAFFRIFTLQGVLAIMISMAVIHINLSPPQAINGWVIAGSVVWLIGFLFEAIGDWQLKRFLAKPSNRGTIMTRGLWRYSRHPNYFGEAVQWWGIALIALTTPFGWVGLLSPVLITYLLLFVSGVPLTEKAFEGRPGWREYAARTSVFLPLPPRRDR